MNYQLSRRSVAFGLLLICMGAGTSLTAQTKTVTFDDVFVPSAGFYNGDIAATGPERDNYRITGTQDGQFGGTETLQLWTSNEVEFFNGFTPDDNFPAWRGASWSNIVDTTTAGFGNQYAAFAGGGSDGFGGAVAGETYGIVFSGAAYFNLPDQTSVETIDVTNGTYGALSMRDGDGFAKRFGGPSGDEADFFSVTFSGFSETDLQGSQTGTVEFLLADFRDPDNANDYILDAWQQVDLSALGAAKSVGFTFSSSDVGQFGINTPQYVAIDNLRFTTAVPEPGGLLIASGLGGFLLRRRKRSTER